MSLGKKALILFLFPFVVGVTLLAMLFDLAQKAERVAIRAEHVRQVTERADIAFEDLCELSFLMSPNTPGHRRYRGYHEQREKLREDLSQLVELTMNDPEEAAAAHELGRLSEHLILSLEEQRSEFVNDSEEFPIGMAETRLQIYSQVRAFRSVFDKLYPRADRDLMRLAAVKARERVRHLLMLGFAVDGLLAVACIVYFNTSIVRRLNVLVRNTIRLTAEEPLEPPLKGEDEIAELDKTFRRMANLLQAEKELKAQITAMLTHDLRTPLNTIQNIVELFETSALAENDNEKSKRYLSMAHRNLESMIALVNDLLEVEKINSNSMQLKLTNVPLAQAFRACKEANQALSEKSELIFQDTDLIVEADEKELARVLTNIPPPIELDTP